MIKKLEAVYNRKDNEIVYGKMVNSHKCFTYFSKSIEEMYKEIINNERSKEGYKNNYFECIEEHNNVKLFIDIDKVEEEELTKSEYSIKCEEYTKSVLKMVNDELERVYNIKNPEYYVLRSEMFKNKVSVHIIYKDVVFRSIRDVKNFMSNILYDVIDKRVYKVTPFRLYKCTKYNEKNELKYNKTNILNYEFNEYDVFVNTHITNKSEENTKKYGLLECCLDKINEDNIKQNVDKKTISDVKHQSSCYKYKISKEVIDMLFNLLDTLDKSYLDETEKWKKIMGCIKDLYVNIDKEELKDYIYKKFDDWSSKSSKYDKIKNKEIFNKMNYIFININTLNSYIPKDINDDIYKKVCEMYLLIKDGKINEDSLTKIINKKSLNNYYIPRYYNYDKISFTSEKYNTKEVNIQDLTKSDEIKGYIKDSKDVNLQFIKSATGTGKTQITKELLNIKCDKNTPIISIVSRVNLGYEINNALKEYNMVMYKENNAYESKRLIVQLDSLINTDITLYENGILLMDEINSLFDYLRSSTLSTKRRKVLNTLIVLIRSVKYIIGLDADLTNSNIDLILSIRGDKSHRLLYNTYKCRENIKCNIMNDDKKIIYNMYKQMIKGEYFVACFDSKSYLDYTVNILLSLIKKNNNTLNNKPYEEYIKIYTSELGEENIDTKEWNEKFVFYSPKVIYGVSYIESDVTVYAIIQKETLNALHINQQIQRCRRQKELYVYCRNKKIKQEYRTIHDVKLYTNNFLKEYKNSIKDVEKDLGDDIFKNIYEKNVYYDDILKSDIKYYLIQILTNYGYNIIIDDNNETDEEVICEKDNELNELLEDKKNIKNHLKDCDNNIFLENNKNSDEDKKLKQKELTLRKMIMKEGITELNNFEERMIEDKNLRQSFINLKRLLSSDNEFIKIKDLIQDKEYKEEMVKHEIIKIDYLRKYMESLNVNINDINENIINRYEEEVNINKDLLEKICKLNELNIIKDTKFYSHYMLLIKLITKACTICEHKRKRIKGTDNKKGYYILNNDYNEYIKIISRIEGIIDTKEFMKKLIISEKEINDIWEID